ncbi:EAL domain-containing protein [Marinicella sp. S1101]|uniref:EAL domain-containing protein n=1 Tax=Marinicella marina TaxID=2996016 RepID=UPI0022608E8D|nr:EAL domain-containing protein [Marinicella marina]MCX7554776.1 EAL domain-containing protein [Marinicella marina]MDJ1140991.1 EAL domain-containing protein [Marinicella marina]
MAAEKSINLLIIHQSEEEAERILSLLRNYQIAVRPTRCTNEEDLAGILERKPLDMVLCQQLQSDLPCQTVVDHIKRMGMDLPVISLLNDFDPDLVHEAIEAGAVSYCTPKLPDHMRHVIQRDFKSLQDRRKNISLELELKNTEKRCNTLLDSSKQAIAYIHDGMHVYSNQSYQELFEYDDFEELEVTPFLNLIAKEDVADAKKILRDITKNIMPEKDLEFKLITSGGEKFDGMINVSKANIHGEQCAQFIINIPSVDPEVEKELFEIKNKDLLTKFYNRSYFNKLLSESIDSAKKKAGDSLLMIGIDDIDKHEKELGIGNLDLFIVSIAEFLQKKLGKDVDYCRYSDSTFILKLKTSIENAEKVADKLRGMITDQIFSAGSTSVNCTVSISVTQLTPQSGTESDVINTLTENMNALIEAGGNQIKVFDPAEEEKQARAASKAWIDRITDGLENDKFVIHYQPIVNIDGDEKEHYEVLIRLKAEEDQLIYPQQFIPVAIKYGFITEIDHWVIKKALESIKSAASNVMLFVKLSHHTLTDASFPNWLADTLKRSGVTGDKLAFEVRESELVTYATQMKPIIKSIKATHCLVVVEKFGSGLNSFSILKHFPVDMLKVDNSFMQDLGSNEENQEKVKVIVDKAHNQGKQVICEFIEDASTMSIMWKMSVNFVQGNFIAEPGETMEQVE